jgi:hypothetical protein
MIIVGGCYRELCESPSWNSVFGSGGRGAVVLAGLAPNVRLERFPLDMGHYAYPACRK